LILSEFHRRSEPKDSAWSRGGMSHGSGVGNSGNQTTRRNPRKKPGFTDRGPEKAPNPTQSEMWRTVSEAIPPELFKFMFPYQHKAEMKDLQGRSIL
jgi:hypothetical protein